MKKRLGIVLAALLTLALLSGCRAAPAATPTPIQTPGGISILPAAA